MWDIESDKIFCNACTRDQEDGRIPSILPRLYKDHSHLQIHLILFPCFNLHLKVSFQLNHVLIVLLLCLSFQRTLLLLIQLILILCFPLWLRVSIYLIRFKLVLIVFITLLCLLLFSWLLFQGFPLIIRSFPFKLDIYRNKNIL